MASMWAELKRRNVIRVAIAYAVVAWLLLQIADVVLNNIEAPSWVFQTILLLVVTGLPIVLVFAWAFELTPEGLKKERDLIASVTVQRSFGRRLDYIIVGTLVIAVGFLFLDRFFVSRGELVTSNINETANGNEAKPEPIRSGSASVKRTVIALGEGSALALAELAPLGVGRRSLAMSSDGNYLAYVVDRGGKSQIYLRRWDEFDAIPLSETEGAHSPFFSPDGQWIGFLTTTQVLKLPLRGGSAQVIAEAMNVYGVAWGPDDKIYFADREGQQISVVSADGGDIDIIPANGWIRDLSILPTGQQLLLSYAEFSGENVELFSLLDQESVSLIERGSSAYYVPTGHILFSGDTGIMVAPFDLETLSITGAAVPVLDDVRREASGVAQFSFSPDGWLAYIPGLDMTVSTPVWVDRNGNEQPIPLEPKRYGAFNLSADNSQVTLSIRDPLSDIWIYNFHRATPPQRLTVGGRKTSPVWSPDGRTVAFGVSMSANRQVLRGIYQQGTNSSNATVMVAHDSLSISPTYWATNGLILYEEVIDGGPGTNVWIARAGDPDNKMPFLNTPADEWGAWMSPDGRYVAYTSGESGQFQVYVKPFPPTDERWMISAGLGEEPVWSSAGDEIFYRRGNQWLSIPVKTKPVFEAGVPRLIFEGPYLNVPGLSYNVSNDAQRFLLLKSPDESSATQIHVVANWFEEIRRLAPNNN